MRFLLDTSAAILLRDGNTFADNRLAEMASVPALSIVSRIELEGGAAAPTPLGLKRRATLDRMLKLFPILDFDSDCAEMYRRIVRTNSFARRKTLDRMIAATAVLHDLTVVTANGADFMDIPDLSLEIWASA